MAPTAFPYKSFVDFTPRVDPFKDLPEEFYNPYAREKHSADIDSRQQQTEYYRSRQQEAADSQAQDILVKEKLSQIDLNDPSSINTVISVLIQAGKFDEAKKYRDMMMKDEKEAQYTGPGSTIVKEQPDGTFKEVYKNVAPAKAAKRQTRKNFVDLNSGRTAFITEDMAVQSNEEDNTNFILGNQMPRKQLSFEEVLEQVKSLDPDYVKPTSTPSPVATAAPSMTPTPEPVTRIRVRLRQPR